MKNPSLKRIGDTGFTVRTCRVAKYLGIKTVGRLKKYCEEHPYVDKKPEGTSLLFASIFGIGYYGFSTKKILQELNEFLENPEKFL